MGRRLNGLRRNRTRNKRTRHVVIETCPLTGLGVEDLCVHNCECRDSNGFKNSKKLTPPSNGSEEETHSSLYFTSFDCTEICP